MHRSIRFLGWVLFFSLGVWPLWAQTLTANSGGSSVSGNLRPIDIQFSTLGGLRYFQGDVELKSDEDFQKAMEPIRDFEAQRLLSLSESSRNTSTILESVGLIGALVGVTGLLGSAANQRTPFWITAAGGAVLFDIGGLFGAQSKTAKFNAVERYNLFAYGREEVLPSISANAQSLLPVALPNPRKKPKKGPVHESK